MKQPIEVYVSETVKEAFGSFSPECYDDHKYFIKNTHHMNCDKHTSKEVREQDQTDNKSKASYLLKSSEVEITIII